MERIRKIKNSAIIIDILLVIAVIVAVIGLTTYVRQRASTKATATPGVSTIRVDKKRAEPLAKESIGNVRSAQTTEQPACGSNCGAQASSPNVNQINNTCDDQAKLQLVDDYNRQLATENNRYDSELKAKQNESGRIDPSVAQSANSQHQQIVSMLSDEVKRDLAKIYCLL